MTASNGGIWGSREAGPHCCIAALDSHIDWSVSGEGRSRRRGTGRGEEGTSGFLYIDGEKAGWIELQRCREVESGGEASRSGSELVKADPRGSLSLISGVMDKGFLVMHRTVISLKKS